MTVNGKNFLSYLTVGDNTIGPSATILILNHALSLTLNRSLSQIAIGISLERSIV